MSWGTDDERPGRWRKRDVTDSAYGEGSKPDEATREAERTRADADHVADRPPKPEEERAADAARDELGDRLDEVALHEREMGERGAHQHGEGAVP
jgi:hypothetical protein